MKTYLFVFAFLIFCIPVYTQSPGGISDSLQIWLRADANGSTTTDGTALTLWSNSAGDNFDLIWGSPTYEIDPMHQLNFNPTIKFDNGDFLGNMTSNFGLNDIEGHSFAITGAFLNNFPYNNHHGFIGPNAHYPDAFEFLMRETDDAIRCKRYFEQSDLVTQPIVRSQPGMFEVYRTHTGEAAFSNQGGQDSIYTIDTLPWNSQARYYVGASHFFANMDGTFPELIIYNKALNASERQKVASYLAIKYGFTLDATSNGSYCNSVGDTIWDANTNPAYHNDVIALAHDAASGLHQAQSKQQDGNLVLFFSDSLYANNLLHPDTMTNNLSALMIGHNNGQLDVDTVLASHSEKPLNITLRIDREWKVKNTSFVSPFSIKLPFDTSGIHISRIRLLVDDDGDFSDATVYGPAHLNVTAEGSFIVIKGINNAQIPENSTRFFAIGISNANKCVFARMTTGLISEPMFVALDNIKTVSGQANVILSPQPVIYQAPTVVLNPGFEVPLGMVFEVINAGCP